MVTASHNPPRDNGYKVYLGDGSQIVPPADAEIAARIAAVGALADVPRGDGWRGARRRHRRPLPRHRRRRWRGDGPRDLAAGLHPAARRRRHLRSLQVLETRGLRRAVRRGAAGAARPRLPDGRRSPTPRSRARWTWPWPWRPSSGADLVVANDPDADRCAAAVPDAARLADAARRRGRAPCSPTTCSRRGRTGTYACSIVSSSLLGKIAAAAGQPYAETLTGFKWIGKVEGLAFGYEEALGYCVDPEHVKDKDGVSALLLLCELAAAEKAEGRTLLDVLDDLAPGPRPARHRPAVGARHRPRARSPRPWSGCAATPPASLGGLAGRVGRRPVRRVARTCRRPTACATGWPTAPG